MKIITYSNFNRNKQRGAFSIMAAGTMLMALLFLVLVLDSGRLYFEQRRLQKVADSAALESITRLASANCALEPANAALFAEENARRNSFLTNNKLQSINTQCATIESANGLRKATVNNTTGPAVYVSVAHTVPSSLVLKAQSFFKDSELTLQASAVAERETPSAVFTVGSQLLRLDNNKLLGGLLKTVGLNPERLTVLDANGLADASITPAGLLKALGVEIGIHKLKALSPEGLIGLVNTQVSLFEVIKALRLSADVVNNSVLATELELLGADILNAPLLKDIKVQLLGDAKNPGILRLQSNNGEPLGSALDAQINLGSILSTSLMLGAQGRALKIDGLNVLGAAKVELGIVEPPSIGIGPVGTQAYNAQIRLYVGVDTDELLDGSLRWLTNLLGTRVNLPIAIDVVSGHGTLTAINCNTITPTVDIDVESKILNACVGQIPEHLKWSGSTSCESNLDEINLIKLLHIPVLSGKTHIPALKQQESLNDIKAGEKVSTRENKLALGHTVEGIVDGLLDLLSGLFRKPTKNNLDLTYDQKAQNELIKQLAIQYLKDTALPGGAYNVKNVTDLILNGSKELDTSGKQIIPPLVKEDWNIKKSIPTTCLITACPQEWWDDGKFSVTFKAYSEPKGLLDVLGISTLPHPYYTCGGLLSALLAWNTCIENNLVNLLGTNPDNVNISDNSDGLDIANKDKNNVDCKGILCIMLKPVIQLLKPILNAVGELLDTILAKVLGLELGRTDVTVESISCGIPRLVE